MTELKPCPFCGGEAETKRHKFFVGSDTYGVVCTKCEARTSQFFDTQAEAIEAWNRRADDEKEVH